MIYMFYMVKEIEGLCWSQLPGNGRHRRADEAERIWYNTDNEK